MEIRYILSILIILLSLVMARPSIAVNPALLQKLIMKLAESADDALKHGDDILKKNTPNSEITPTQPSDNLNLGGAAGRSSKNLSCRPSENFPNAVDTLVVTGDEVNIRTCGSNECTIITRVKKGRYSVDAIKQDNCWIDFEFTDQSGKKFSGSIYEKFATIE